MAGTIIQVWFETEYDIPLSSCGKLRFYVIETELQDFATVCEMLDADRLIGGAILSTDRVGASTMQITNRRPIAFRGEAVARCELPRFSYVEGDAA